jgi:hypothetical protein
MFIVALFTIDKLWKQPRCPTTEKWVKKTWHLYTIEFYSATKKNENLSFTGKWMELENILISEISQTQKDKSCILSLRWNVDLIQIQQYYETLVTLREFTHSRGKETKNMFDILAKQE